MLMERGNSTRHFKIYSFEGESSSRRRGSGGAMFASIHPPQGSASSNELWGAASGFASWRFFCGYSSKFVVLTILILEMMGGGERKRPDLTLSYAANHFSTSGASVAIATTVTHPFDVVKVRLQMQLAGQRGPLVGMGTIFSQMVKKEGPRSLYLGLGPAVTRSLIYGGLRLGLYEPSKYVLDHLIGSTSIIVKIASGAFSGAIATGLTNPMEVLKVRLQMNSSSQMGPLREIHRIISHEGLKAFWKGVGPAMARASCLTASQMATYDESKQALLKWSSLEEGFGLHLISSCIAGTMGTLVTAPVDMIKTRLMLQRETSSARTYRNALHCGYQVVVTEGFGALYKGFELNIEGEP